MDWTLLTVQFLNGLQLGILLFLLASGLTLIFGIMDVVNLAHGSLYMAGAFLCATFTQWFDSFFLGLLAALPAVAIIGLLVERIVIRRLYQRDHLDHVLATFGLILAFDALTQMIWGPDGQVIPLPAWLDGQVMLTADIVLPTYRLAIITTGLLVAVGLFVLVTQTRLGMRIRAGATNRTMISALGINIGMLFSIVFGIGAVLAGLAGMMIAPITEASIGMGNQIIIVAFVVIVIGGIGSIKGAFIAAILVGLIDTMGRSYLDALFKLFMSVQNAETSAPAISAMLIYILMAVILAVRPTGLFGPRGH
ncbi:MAG: branched-chain amino acid ABC transporter permease [Acidiferrobacteraceae bacterium]|jgi:branched-chain amino acid transport system permease protein|nr:branched-chain amino acid ABC transporter permease [Acidiferrobacteraceae bacterium]MBT3639375.1 branched-chain amino acid ABC transporter permease [Acidiferrobacteraceae bacterium]MBT3768732.1 branched-chain amino acid ABC transporter permease [Acidiferrobacteraceae bacterium]MBT4396446.1 branched-chain amino acid ABC transporter permease [Acidiferrobacteraceae bacterium]MBT4405347.1 branched-chain amino acid ABC transporter permease [Acidiferrobacteraceae bacterium]